jgi:hypothetical protein
MHIDIQSILFGRENDRAFHTTKLYVQKLQLDYNARGFYFNKLLDCTSSGILCEKGKSFYLHTILAHFI